MIMSYYFSIIEFDSALNKYRYELFEKEQENITLGVSVFKGIEDSSFKANLALWNWIASNLSGVKEPYFQIRKFIAFPFKQNISQDDMKE